MLQVLERFDTECIWVVRDVVDMDVHRRNNLLKMDAQKMYVSVHDC
jgi:hypothetical protein